MLCNYPVILHWLQTITGWTALSDVSWKGWKPLSRLTSCREWINRLWLPWSYLGITTAKYLQISGLLSVTISKTWFWLVFDFHFVAEVKGHLASLDVVGQVFFLFFLICCLKEFKSKNCTKFSSQVSDDTPSQGFCPPSLFFVSFQISFRWTSKLSMLGRGSKQRAKSVIAFWRCQATRPFDSEMKN